MTVTPERSGCKQKPGSTRLYELLSASSPFYLLFGCHLTLKLNNIWSCHYVNQQTLQTQKVKLSLSCWIPAPGTLNRKAQPTMERTGDSSLGNVSARCVPYSYKRNIAKGLDTEDL